MVEFMRAAGETRTQKHDEGNVTADAKCDFVDELVRGRFGELETGGHKRLVILGGGCKLRIPAVDAVGVSRSNPELGTPRGVQRFHRSVLIVRHLRGDRAELGVRSWLCRRAIFATDAASRH